VVDHKTPHGRSAHPWRRFAVGLAGLDVHARSVLAVTLDAHSDELRSQRLPGETAKVVEFLSCLPGPTRAAYEAGPTGYGLARVARGGDRVRGRRAGGRSSGRRRTRSRPTCGTPSGCCGC
jgi:hypothetical protein